MKKVKKKVEKRSAKTAQARTTRTRKKQEENRKLIKNLLVEMIEKELKIVMDSFSQNISQEVVEFLRDPEEIKEKLVEELFVAERKSLAIEIAKKCSPEFKKGLVLSLYRYDKDRLAKKAAKELGVELMQEEIEESKWEGFFDDLI